MKNYKKIIVLITLIIGIIAFNHLYIQNNNNILAETITQEKDQTYRILDIGVVHAWLHSDGETWQYDIMPNKSHSYPYNNIYTIPANANDVSVTIYPSSLLDDAYTTNNWSVNESVVTFDNETFLYNIFGELYTTDKFSTRYGDKVPIIISTDKYETSHTNYNADNGKLSWQYDATFSIKQAFDVANRIRAILYKEENLGENPYQTTQFVEIEGFIGYDAAKKIYDDVVVNLNDNVEGYFFMVPQIITYTVTETTTIEIGEEPTEIEIPDDIEILMPEIEELKQKTSHNVWIFGRYGNYKFLSPYEDIKYSYEGVQPFTSEMYDEIDYHNVLTSHKVVTEGKTTVNEYGLGLPFLHHEEEFTINPYDDYGKTSGDIDVNATITSPFGKATASIETNLIDLPDITAKADFELVYASKEWADYTDTYIVREGAKLDFNNLGTATDLYASGMQVEYNFVPYKDNQPSYFVDNSGYSRKKTGSGKTYYVIEKSFSLNKDTTYSSTFQWILDYYLSRKDRSDAIYCYIKYDSERRIYIYKDEYTYENSINTYERETLEFEIKETTLDRVVAWWKKDGGNKKNKTYSKDTDVNINLTGLDADLLNQWLTSGSYVNKVKGYSAYMNKASLRLNHQSIYSSHMQEISTKNPSATRSWYYQKSLENYPYEDIKITQTISPNIYIKNSSSGGYRAEVVDSITKKVMFYGEDSILTVSHIKLDINDKQIGDTEIEHVRIKFADNEITTEYAITLKVYGYYKCTEEEPVTRTVVKGEHVETEVYYKNEMVVEVERELKDETIEMKSGYGLEVELEVTLTTNGDLNKITLNKDSKITFLDEEYQLELVDKEIKLDEVVFTLKVEKSDKSKFNYRRIYTDVALADGEYMANINAIIDSPNNSLNINETKTIIIKGHMYENYFTH